MNENSNTPINAGQTYTIKSAAAALGMSEQYIRSAIRSGDLETVLVPIADGATTKRHEIEGETLAAWREAHQNRSHREDGRNRFILYATPAELDVLKTAFPELVVVKPTYGKKETELEAE